MDIRSLQSVHFRCVRRGGSRVSNFEFRISPAALSVYPKRARRLTQVRSLFVAALATTTAAALSTSAPCEPWCAACKHGLVYWQQVDRPARAGHAHAPELLQRARRAPSRVSACTAAALSLCVCDSRVQNSRCLFKLGSSSRSSSSLTSVSVSGFSDLLSHTSSPPRSATPHASSS